jgi:hypothetical protein
MEFKTPDQIAAVAWEGELEASANAMGGGAERGPVVTIGQLEIWPAAQALENEVGKKWSPPLGDAGYWLVRLACTLRAPAGWGIAEAVQTLTLRPRDPGEAPDAVYAFSLFPDRVTAERTGELSATLGPELKFGEAVQLKAGELGAKITLRQVYPVIQSFGAGEPAPYWIFKPHMAHPLTGTQFVYAVLVDRAGAAGITAEVDITVTAQSQFGPIRYGTPWEGMRSARFEIQ